MKRFKIIQIRNVAVGYFYSTCKLNNNISSIKTPKKKAIFRDDMTKITSMVYGLLQNKIKTLKVSYKIMNPGFLIQYYLLTANCTAMALIKP